MKMKRSKFKQLYKEIDEINNIVYILEEYCKKEASTFEECAIKTVVECIHDRTGKLVVKFLDDYSRYI